MSSGTPAHSSWRRWLLPVLLLTAGLLPLALLSYYNHPFMDDYFNAANARKLGFWAGQRDLYLNWTGRFFSSLVIVGANPMHYDWPDGLRLIPFLILSASYGVGYLSVRTLSPAGRPRVEAAVLTGIILLAYFQIVPGLYPALYWFTGSIVYQLAGLWVLLTLVAGVRAGRATSLWRRRGWWAVAAFSTVAAAGSNEVSMLHVLLGTGLMAGLHWRRPVRNAWLALFALGSVAAVVAVAAPGNFARMAVDYSQNPVQRSLLEALLTAVPRALVYSLHFFGQAHSLVWLGLVAVWTLVVLHWHRAGGLPAAPRLPWKLGLPLLLASLYGTELMLQLAMGGGGFPDRVSNALWLFWLPASLGLVWAAVVASPELRTRRLPKLSIPAILTIALVVLHVMPLPRRAWRELLVNGPSFDRQMLAREEMLRGAKWRQQQHLVVLPILDIEPERVLISGWDLSTDPNFYVNYETALYFEIETLRVDEKLLQQAHPAFQDNH
jgi:hypothetical protein